jgi:small subunit ribosomal protein S17
MSETEKTNKTKRTLTGVVVSDKATKTVVVKVERKTMHPKYSKFVTTSKKYHAHDDKELATVGNLVTIVESRPYSKLKRWELVSIVK